MVLVATSPCSIEVFRITIVPCGVPPLQSSPRPRRGGHRPCRRQRRPIIDLEPDADPPKVLAIGPDHAGNLVEIIWLDLDDGREVVIHAMPLRPAFHDLLPRAGEESL